MTVIRQLVPAAKVVPQPLEMLKSAEFVPVKLTFDRVNATDPELLSVTVCALLVVPTVWEANVRLLGLAAA